MLIAMLARPAIGQLMRFPSSSGGAGSLSAMQTTPVLPPNQPSMIPLGNAAPSINVPYPGTGFDAYAPASGGAPGMLGPGIAGQPAPQIFGNSPNSIPFLPNNSGAFSSTAPLSGLFPQSIPGAGVSGSIGAYPGGLQGAYPTGTYPQSTPPALFPNGFFTGGGVGSGPIWGNLFGNSSSSWNGVAPGTYGTPGGSLGPPGSMGPPGLGSWNPPGTMFAGNGPYPGFIRLFQGPRFRHTWIAGSEDDEALQVNDSDVSLAFAIPNFLFSTQPLYLLPSFSLHSWDGPASTGGADLPALAYSAFLDSGWQSDSSRILGAELGLRVGMFSDFNTATSESLRIMGRGLGRIRLTPAAMLKLGVIYYDRNSLKLLPAGGLLWQPDPLTRFDLFFPEPKLAHYLATLGRFDTWWYVGGYYGGGSWTIERASGATDSIDMNDIRLLLGLEWGRNEQIRDGRRVGFFEVGYVFKRELEFKYDPVDNIDLQDSLFLRAGFGY